jgi:hypothetical protein
MMYNNKENNILYMLGNYFILYFVKIFRKISQDTPHWFQTTTNYYRRDEAPTRPKNVFQ